MEFLGDDALLPKVFEMFLSYILKISLDEFILKNLKNEMSTQK